MAQLLIISFLGSPLLLSADPVASNSPYQSTPTDKTVKLVLRDHWTLQSSAKVEAKGEVVSTTSFVPEGMA